jgi:hypothetical protein
MVNQIRTLDFLPEIFQTETNKQFLGSTLDVLTSQPDLTRVQGYIGNKYGYGVLGTDKYVDEITDVRGNYQLDPAVVFLKEDTQTATDFIDYPGIIAALGNAGAATNDHNKLFSNEVYSWESFADPDKLVNYAQYYWLPLGPDPILIYDDIVISDIVGKTTYTTPSGITLVNGLKVNFSGTTTPASYYKVNYYVEGVGSSIVLVPDSEMLCTEVTGGGIYTPWDNDNFDIVDWSIALYVPTQPDYVVINRSSRDRNAWSRGNRWFHQSVLDLVVAQNGQVTVNQYNTQTRAQRPIVEFQANLSLYNSGTIGASVVDFFDTVTTDALSQVAGQEHFTVKTSVNRTSTRTVTNQLVINNTDNLYETMAVRLTGILPTTTPQVKTYSSADSSTVYYINSVDVSLKTISLMTKQDKTGTNITISADQACSVSIVGISEVGLQNNTTVVFANDNDINVRKTVYNVTSVPAGVNGKNVIALTAVPEVSVDEGSQIHIAAGPGDYQGTSWRFTSNSDGVIRPAGEISWTQSQAKDSINQPPYFDVYDTNGSSFSDSSFYMNTTFAGSRLFGYEIGTGTNDSVLGFPVVYSSPANTGDFLFSVNLNSDTFTYTSSTGSTITKKVSDGFVHSTPTIGTTVKKLGWVKAAAPSVQYQVFIKDITEQDQLSQATTTLAGVSGSYSLHLASVNGIKVGNEVTGSGLLEGTKVTKISGNVVTLSKALLSDATGEYAFSEVQTSSKVSGKAKFNEVAKAVDLGAGKVGSYFLQLNNTTGISVGDVVSGYGVVSGTKVTKITGEVVTLSNPLVNDLIPDTLEDAAKKIPKNIGYDTYTFNGGNSKTYGNKPAYRLDTTIIGAVKEITISDSTVTVERGQSISGYGIPADTVILAVNNITEKQRTARGLVDVTRGYQVTLNNAIEADIQGVYKISRKVIETDFVAGASIGSNKIIVSSTDSIKVHQIMSSASITNVVQVEKIDYTTNTITLNSALTAIDDVYSFRNSDVTCDIIVMSETDTAWAPVQVYKNGSFIINTDYTVTVDLENKTTAISFATKPAVGDQISVSLLSKQVSKTGFYQIPSNLQSNPFNDQITTVAAGDLKNYYSSIFSNTQGATGDVFGSNNLNNLGDVTKYGATIVQNSGSLLLPGLFLRKAEYNLENSLQYSSDEYYDYKASIIDLAVNGDYSVYQKTYDILDDIIYQISSTKSQDESFYWSDMLVAGSPYKVNTYTFQATLDTSSFQLTRTYDYTSANYYGVAVYITQTINSREVTTQLVRGADYTVSATEPSLYVSRSIEAGTTVTIKEYNQTYGSYVPNTPTKLGLYPATVPHVVTDNTYAQPTTFIVGHDGSYTRLYGNWDGHSFTDFRDAVLFEFEVRIYNNLKTSGKIPVDYTDVFPGQWRYGDYSWADLLPAYTTNFLNWVGKNRLTEYRRQVFTQGNKFTYNYNKSTNRLNGELMKSGNWRGIYNWFYDTSNPADAPWEMLGLTFKPQWWDAHYGAAPYTSGNTLMWQDIADGRVWNNGSPYIVATRVRPGLLDVLPVDEIGRLVDPMVKTIGAFNENTFERNWVAGDMGPTETAYRRSSSWPFDLMKMLAAFKPVNFYNLNVDRDLYKYDEEHEQYLFNSRYHLVPSEIDVYGSGIAKHSYINWVVDYVKQHGTDGQSAVSTTLKNMDVRLVHKIAGFSDKEYLQFLTENSAPSSTTNSLLIPDESYSILLYDNIPSDKIVYSSVIIQKTNNGYTVWGNSITAPYFKVVSPVAGPYEKVTVGTTTVDLSTKYDPNSSVTIAYGTEFYSMTGVAEFLRNYGRFLKLRGVTFENLKNEAHSDWDTMGQEFLSWAQQSWEIGSTINLNPNATSFTAYRQGMIVQPLTLRQQNFVLNQNLIPLENHNMAVIRDNESFKLKTLSEGDTIALTHLNLSTIEHAAVFDNKTIFGDTIYSTTSGLRMGRLIMKGKKTANWSGYVNAYGFILNQADIDEWTSTLKYPKGQIVIYKNLYWSATTLIEASDTFDYTLWQQVSYDSIKQGLLPNPSTVAYEATQVYDIQQANLDQDKDLLAFGLIGFRKRNYLADAALTDVTQINVYKNMIKSKGTNLSADAFKGAEPLQGELDYDVYENWALKTADFGSVLNSNYVEVQLHEDQLTGNPAIIGFGDGTNATTSGSTFQAGVQQKVSVGSKSDLINYSRSPSSDKFLPTYDLTYVEERGLPTAGYVNIDDTTFQAYNLTDLNTNSDNYDMLYRGDVVWVAHYYTNDDTETIKQGWDIFTPVSVNTSVTTAKNNLNGTVTLTFAGQHGLSKYDPFVVVGFDRKVNGYYTVSSVTSLTSLVIKKTLSKSDLKITGTGVAFKLNSVRVSQPSSLSEISEHVKYSEFSTRRVWADGDSNGNWAVYKVGPVYKKTASDFGTYTDSSGNTIDSDTGKSGLGTSVAYTARLGTLSTDSSGKLYQSGIDKNIVIGGKLTAVDVGTTSYIYGTDGTDVYQVKVDNGEWSTAPTKIATQSSITALAVSGNRRWMYIATSTQTIYSYLLVVDSVTNVEIYTKVSDFTFTNAVGGFGKSMSTTYDGSKLIVGAPEESGGVNLQEAGAVYVYSRGSVSSLANGTDTSFPTTGTITGSVVDVYINNEHKTSGYSIVSGKVVFDTAPADGSVVYIDYGTLTLQQRIVSSNPHLGGWFGHSVSTNKYGAEVFIGAPYELKTVNEVKNVEGAVYRYTNAGQRYGVVTATPTSYPVTSTIYIDGYKVNINSSSKLANPSLPSGTNNPEMTGTDTPINRIVYQINSQEPTNVVATVSGTSIVIQNKEDVPGVPNDFIDIVGATLADLTALGISSYKQTQVIYDLNLDNNSQFGWTVVANQGITSTRDSIAISAPSVNTIIETTFDFTDDLTNNDTIFDNGATTFVDTFAFTGGVYQYDYLTSAYETIDKPGMYAFGQYCNVPTTDTERQTLQSAAPKFGTSLYFNDGAIIVGSPSWYKSGNGRVTSFINTTKYTSTWHIDKQPLAQVDVSRLRSISIYNTDTNATLEHLDYIDPAQGKMLSAVETNIDFISATDPATYTGGIVWGKNHVGTVWLDTTNLRMMNYNQPDIVYNSAHFGRAFPGSLVDIYTWISSDVSPLTYSGSGFPTNYDNYTTATVIDKSSNSLVSKYFFWVKNYTLVPQGKKLSPMTLVQYILNPINSGVPFLAALTTNTVALYNSQDSIKGSTSALHLGYSTGINNDVGHQDWTLLQDGNEESFLNGVPSTIDGTPSAMYLKYITSFMGKDLQGLVVPDPALPELVKYGTSFRPRQSMFADRALALKNFVQYANSIMTKYTIAENCGIYLLNQQYYFDAEVTTDSTSRINISYDSKTVTDIYVGCPIVFTGVGYGDLEVNKTYYITSTGIDSGVQYITVSATLGGSNVTLSDATGTMTTRLYDTTRYWSYSDWWATGYNASTKVTLEVNTYTDLLTIGAGQITVGSSGNITLSNGLVARVAKNGNGVNEYYVYNETTGWSRIGVQNGTIQINSALYTTTSPIPSMEIYYVVRWITEQLYVNELLVENNQSLMMMFSLIQSEALQQQNYMPWLNKTSLVDIKHTIRQLYAYKKYQHDTRELVNGYINEVKPFHVYIKDFSFKYDGIDYYEGSFTDFDLPAEYSTNKFISPQLVYSDAQTGQYLPTDAKWTETSYSSWFNHYGLTISNSQVSTVLVTKLTAIDINDSAPRSAMTETSTSFKVDDVTTLPVRGVVLIGTEQIKYTKIDRITNTISGLTRGYNIVQPKSYSEGTPVYLVPDSVMVVDSGRGYTSKPSITAYFDTNTYPYGPRIPATFSAVLSEETLVGVTLDTAGSGYPVLPGIKVSPSSVKGIFQADQVDTELNQIYIASHPFVDGDCVTVTDIEDDSNTKELKNYNYYYIKSLDKDHVALYESYKDAVSSSAAFTTTETQQAFVSTTAFTKNASNVITGGGYITLSNSDNIDLPKFNTGDKVQLIYGSSPSTVDYYYAEDLSFDTSGPTATNKYVGAQRIALYKTKEEAIAGIIDTRFVPTKTDHLVDYLVAAPRIDENRIALFDKVSGTLAVTARVKIYTNNLPIREMKVALKFDRLTYGTKAKSWSEENSTFGLEGWDTTEWSKGTTYLKDQLVVYEGGLYRANKDITSTGIQGYYVLTSDNTTVVSSDDSRSKKFIQTSLTGEADTFNLAFWNEVKADDLYISAADRIAGYYKPTVNMTGFTFNDMSSLMSGVKNPYPTITDYSFANTTTYAFLAGQVDLSNNTVELRKTEPEVVTYLEHIIGSSGNVITLETSPVVTDTDGSANLTVKSTMNLHIGDKIKFEGTPVGNIINNNVDTGSNVKNKNYVISSVDSTKNTISIGNSTVNAISFTEETGYMTILPLEYNIINTTLNRNGSNTIIGGTITLNTGDYIIPNTTVRFSNSIVTTTATQTYASTNPTLPSQILVTSTKNMTPGMKIEFNEFTGTFGTGNANSANNIISATSTYYIKEVIDTTHLTITTTANGWGPVLPITALSGGTMTVKATGIVGKYTTQKSTKVAANGAITVANTASLATGMTVVFTGTAAKPVFGGLNYANNSGNTTQSANYTITGILSGSEISVSGNSTPLVAGTGTMTMTAQADGIIADTNYYVTSVSGSNITLSNSYNGSNITTVSSTGIMSAKVSSYRVIDVSPDKYITVVNASNIGDVSFLNIGDTINLTGTSFSGLSNVANYTVKSIDRVVNKITVAEDSSLNAATGNMTVWRKDTPVATSFTTGDIVKVNYVLPTSYISDNAYVEKTGDNTIKLHTTSIGASTSLTTDVMVIPYNATGTVAKPQTIVALKDPISSPIGTVLPVLFEQSLTPTNFGLINHKKYYIRVITDRTVAVYNYEDDADVDIDRIPLVSQQGGQFIYGSNYDSIIKSGDTGAVDIVGADFTSGYAPEELVAGILTDGINFTVTTRPGATWDPLAGVNEIAAYNIIPGGRYRILSLGDGDTNWDTITGITGFNDTAMVGDDIFAVNRGSGTGIVASELYGSTGFNMTRLSNITPTPLSTKLENGTDYGTYITLAPGPGTPPQYVYKYISFKDVVMSPVYVTVYINNRSNITGQTRLTPNVYTTRADLVEYYVDWINKVILIKEPLIDAGKTYDVVVHEYGNGSLLLRSNSERYPLRKVLNKGSKTEYHSEIYLDVPYHELELPSSSNYWLSAQVVVGSSISGVYTDTVRLTHLRDLTSPEYGDIDPAGANFKPHYTIEAQRTIDPVNDPYNPAKIVFTEEYDGTTHYASFALTSNVVGMFTAGLDSDGSVRKEFKVHITDINYISDKIVVKVNEKSVDGKYSLSTTLDSNGMATIKFNNAVLTQYDNIKITYDNNGIGIPTTEWILASTGTPYTKLESINTILGGVAISNSTGGLTFTSTSVNFGTAWDNSKAYKAGDIARYSGSRYSANTTTTVGTWVASEWTLAELSVVVSGTLTQLYYTVDDVLPPGKAVGDPKPSLNGSITGYVNPTTYAVSVTNGSTTLTLAGVTTTAGATNGLTFTLVTPKSVSRYTYEVDGFLGDNNYSAITTDKDGMGIKINSSTGALVFMCSSTIQLKVNDAITVTGTLTGTATINGYSAPKVYYIASTDGYSEFTLSTYFGGPANLVGTAGTLTGLTFSIENNLVVEINGLRYDGPSPTQIYRKIVEVGTLGQINLSYPAPVYSISDFDITYFTVQVNGSDIPQVDPVNNNLVNWNVNYDFVNGQFFQMDADFVNKQFNTTITADDISVYDPITGGWIGGVYGFFDDGTPFDNQTSFNVVFNPRRITLNTKDIVTLSYQVPGEIPPDTFIVEANSNKIGGKIHIISSAIDINSAEVAFTTFNRTTDQNLITQRITDATVSLIQKFSNLANPSGGVYPGFTVDGVNPPLLTTYDSEHSLVAKNPLQQVVIRGTGITQFDDKTFWVSTLNYKTNLSAPNPSRQVYLYTTNTPSNTGGWDIISSVNFTKSAGYMQVVDSVLDLSIPTKTPLQIRQPAGYVMTDVNRLYVSVISKDNDALRQYISPSNLKLVQYNNVSTLLINKAINAGDEVLVTSMVPQASPGERKFRINNTWNSVSGMPNDPVVHRENEFTRTYITEVTYSSGELLNFKVSKPYDLVSTSKFTNKVVKYDSDAKQYYITVDGVLNSQIVNTRVYNSTTKAEISSDDSTYGWSYVSVSNLTTIKIVFKTNPGFNIDVTVSAGNTLLINGEQLKYTSINLTYGSGNYGLIDGLTRGVNATGTSVISQYDIVQSILSENILEAKYNNIGWYDNVIDLELKSKSGNVYTVAYTSTTDSTGLTEYSAIGQAVTNNIVAFGDYDSAKKSTTFGVDSFDAKITQKSSNGVYVFDIRDLNSANVTSNSINRLNSTSTHIVGLTAGDVFNIKYANGVSITHGNSSNAIFKITDSYVNSANSSQWIIEADTAIVDVETSYTLTFSNAISSTHQISNSYVGGSEAAGYTWNLETTGGPSTVTNKAISVTYNSGYPLQMDNSDVAQFLNKQSR